MSDSPAIRAARSGGRLSRADVFAGRLLRTLSPRAIRRRVAGWVPQARHPATDRRLGTVSVVAPLVFLWCAARAGAPVDLWLVVAVTALALWSVMDSDSPAGTVEVLVLVGSWLVGVPGGVRASGDGSQMGAAQGGWLLGAAASLICYHATVALASTLPPQGRHDHPTLRRWALRSGLLVAGAAGVWVLELAISAWDVRGNAVTLGAGLLLLVGAGWWSARSG